MTRDPQLKLYELLPKKPGITAEAFHHHWQFEHAPLSDPVTALLQYVQSHREGGAVPPFAGDDYDGVAEAWFDDLDTALGLAKDPAFLNGAAQDEPNFIDVGRIVFVHTEPRGQSAGGGRAARTDRIKLLCFLSAAPGATREDVDQSRPSADQIAAELGADLVVQSRPVVVPGADGGPPFAGVDEIFFPDAATAASKAERLAALLARSAVVTVADSLGIIARQVRIS